MLLESGYPRKAAFLLNALSAAATIPGGVAGYFWLPQASGVIPYVLALSAASFIYVAAADLMPMLNRRLPPTATVLQLALLFAGVATIAAVSAHRQCRRMPYAGPAGGRQPEPGRNADRARRAGRRLA